MHSLFPAERPRGNTPRDYGAGARGLLGASQPHQAARAGGFPEPPASTPGRLGHRGQSAQDRGHDGVSCVRTAIAAPVSRASAGRILRGGSAALRLLALVLIRFYQSCLSPISPSSCRFYPSCSAYAYEAIEKWGAWQGIKLTVRRLGRCRPWGGQGYDPVP